MEHTLQELDRLGEASQGYEANQALDEQLPELLIQVQMSLEELRDQ
jgi:hypothetical protein